jgi:succinate dehydrogenase / fumarate reductase, cytochrome b subunit
MSKPVATRTRPLSPHLSVYRWPVTMAMSILHRITGGALYFGTLLVAWWLIATATSQEYFDLVSDIYGSWLGRLVLFGYSWALIHHMLGGIRHLIWDTGAALEKRTASAIAWVNVVASIVLTVLVWVAGYAVRGGL